MWQKQYTKNIKDSLFLSWLNENGKELSWAEHNKHSSKNKTEALIFKETERHSHVKGNKWKLRRSLIKVHLCAFSNYFPPVFQKILWSRYNLLVNKWHKCMYSNKLEIGPSITLNMWKYRGSCNRLSSCPSYANLDRKTNTDQHWIQSTTR